MEPRDHSLASPLKTVAAGFGTVAFLAASVVVACQARHYQVTGQPMPNGKGGFMTSGDGYLFALVLFLFSIAWFVAARKLWRTRSV